MALGSEEGKEQDRQPHFLKMKKALIFGMAMISKKKKDNNSSSESTKFKVKHSEISDHSSGDAIDHTDQAKTGDNEELGTQHDLSSYQLVRDRAKRVIKPTKRYDHADIICYTLNVAEEIQNSEPKTWREAIESEDSQLWLQAMNEEMEEREESFEIKEN